MRLLKLLSVAASAVLLTTACDIKVDTTPKEEPIGVNWPAYAGGSLAGKVFSQDWRAVSAVARLDRSGASETPQVIVAFYQESVPAACNQPFYARLPYATMKIPQAYAVQEIATDLTRALGNAPLAFVFPGTPTKIVVADKTKLNIQTLTEFGFDGALYAQATESNGTVSEINGRVSVMDCTKAADFSVWNELVGSYRLLTFDGQTQDGRNLFVGFDNDLIVDPKNGQTVKALLLPLFTNISAGEQFDVGPLNGLGISRLTTQGNIKTLSYSFNGPIVYRGESLTLNLELRVLKNEGRLDVAYTLNVPGKIPLSSHQMTLQRN